MTIEEQEIAVDMSREILGMLIFGEYPQYRQNNLALYGTDEEKIEFKKFKDKVSKDYKKQKSKLLKMGGQR